MNYKNKRIVTIIDWTTVIKQWNNGYNKVLKEFYKWYKIMVTIKDNVLKNYYNKK